MDENIKYYVVKQKALPEVLLKVAQANRLIETKGISVADATEQVGISRSSYYKYKEDIFPFRDNIRGKTLTFVLQMHDEPGLLSDVEKSCRISRKYFNNSSDYTGKRRRIADIECGYSAKHRRFFKDD